MISKLHSYKFNFFFALLLSSFLFTTSCNLSTDSNANNDIFDTNCAITTDCEGVLAFGYYTLFQSMASSNGIHMNLLADQHTTTNFFRNFYSFADEPRLRLDHRSGAVNTDMFLDIYDGLSSSIQTANIILAQKEVIDPDRRPQIEAQAYFLRGVARGYLGLIYNESLFRDETNFEEVDLSTLRSSIVGYSDLIDSSLADIDRVIQATSENSSIVLNNFIGESNVWTADKFHDISNSFAARILAGKARTYEESQNTDWQKVLNYVEKGIGGSQALSNITEFSVFNSGSITGLFHDFANLSNTVVNGDFETGAGYVPTDIKIFHLLDPTYPTEYPEDSLQGGVLTLREASSDDPRLSYYKYTTNLGFFVPSRNKALFSNYFSARMFAENNWTRGSEKIVYFTASESQYLKAEAHLMMDQNNEAANALTNSPAGNVATSFSFELPSVKGGYIGQNSLSGGYTFDGTESLSEFQLALLREYSVELETFGGIGIQWFFMRRHDLLQAGSPTMYPLPGRDLEFYELDYYSYGGVNVAGQTGTASGANSWKDLREKIANE